MAVPIFMVLSGYLLTRSYNHRGYEDLLSVLSPKVVVPLFLRYVLPFLLLLPFEIRYALKKAQVSSISELLTGLACGGWGPGGYYVCMLFQLIIVFPFIWYLVKRLRAWGFVCCFILNFLYEVFQWWIEMDGQIYRILVFRYLAALAFGVFIVYEGGSDVWRARILRWSIFLLGYAFIVLNSYVDWRPFFITKGGEVCLFSALYAMAITNFWIVSPTFHVRMKNPRIS